MSEQNQLNYAGDIIPDPEILFSTVDNIEQKIANLQRYSFMDLFPEVNLYGRTEYHRNRAIWGETFQYNTWNNKAIEEAKQPEHNRKKMNEVSGLYIFYENESPIYTGISRAILRRLKNHFLGKSHFEASLAYLILRHKHDQEKGVYYGERANLQLFNEEREFLQKQMRSNWKIAIIPMTDSHQMYLSEFYIACQLKTKWNSFETH